MGIDRGSGVGLARKGLDRGIGGGESGDTQEEWGRRGREWGYTGGGVGWEGERVGIDRGSGVGGKSGDRQEE